MSWSRRKSKQRSKVIRRRSAKTERLIALTKGLGLVIGVLVLLGWLGAWFFMSDADTHTANWARAKTLEVTADKGFIVKNILVEGRKYTDAQTLKTIIDVEKGEPLLRFDPDDTQEMLSRLSWVREVRVERRFPDTIYVELTERVPMALWQRNKRLSLIDTEGVVLTDHDLERFQDFVVVIGDEVPKYAPEFVQTLHAEPEIITKMEAAVLKSGRRWDLALKSGAVVKLPEGDIALAFRRLVQMQAEKQIMDKDIKTIDVRDPSRILVRTHPGAVEDYQEQYQKANMTGDSI